STRPGADQVSEEEELWRVVDVIRTLAGDGTLVSLDTRRAGIMRAGLDAGAKIINDVTALTFENDSRAVVAAAQCPVVLMHIRGEPKTMQDDPYFDDVVLEVYNDLAEHLDAAEKAGIDRNRILIDPGIGFGKTFTHNLQLLERLSIFHGLGGGLLVGLSRKGFIGAVTGVKDAGERVHGSIGAAMSCILQGTHVMRVHDLAATKQALDAWQHAMGIANDPLQS
ncbi:MAG: dihydropteroate synthase, partial [Fimbriimonadaceae bacterium]|nr:dihydropteroate synthase [Alphaproteobacteria bacterium]